MSCGERELAAGQTFAVESLSSAEQLACQAKQSADLTATQTAAAAVVEEGRRLGDPTSAFPCWQIIS